MAILFLVLKDWYENYTSYRQAPDALILSLHEKKSVYQKIIIVKDFFLLS